MFNYRNLLIAALICVGAVAQAQTSPKFSGVGREATAAEVNAWNIDVRPDFKGLPKGKGTVAQGEKIWEEKCSSCHGIFGESNSVFNPIIGGTKKADIESGHVATLREEYPGRTTMMKLSSVASMWDYIRRAMPWTAPKSLSVDEVYAVTAYILNMAEVLPADYTLSDVTIKDAQAKLPNRNGMTTQHAMWPSNDFKGAAKPDVQGSNCMKDCGATPQIKTRIPDFARNAHGNLADQNRLVGAQRGANTDNSNGQKPAKEAGEQANTNDSINKLLSQYTCTACHSVEQKLVGPAFKEIAAKYKSKADAESYLNGKIRSGGTGVWGQIPMPAQTLSEAEAGSIAKWLVNLK